MPWTKFRKSVRILQCEDDLNMEQDLVIQKKWEYSHWLQYFSVLIIVINSDVMWGQLLTLIIGGEEPFLNSSCLISSAFMVIIDWLETWNTSVVGIYLDGCLEYVTASRVWWYGLVDFWSLSMGTKLDLELIDRFNKDMDL